MFSKRSMFTSLVAIAVAASIAVAGAKSAKAGNPYSPSAYVYGGASHQVAQAIQSVGGTPAPTGRVDQIDVTNLPLENGLTANQSAALAAQQGHRSVSTTRNLRAARGFTIITDTLGGNGHPLRHAQAPVKTRSACVTHVGGTYTGEQEFRWPLVEPVASTLGPGCETSSAPSPSAGSQTDTVDQGFRWLLTPAR
jgi:hypothetical protein